MLDRTLWTRDALEKHSVDMRQFCDFRQSTLPNGMRIIEAYNAAGLHFTILPDRGLDIWTAHYKGVPLTWVAQGSPFAPDFGQSWLRQFNGGLLTTCGLTHAGPPERDDLTGDARDLHGNFTRLVAHDISISSAWEGDTYFVKLEGSIAEASLFGSQLLLRRTYVLRLDQPTIHFYDTVINKSDAESPLMLLYHINLGYPLIRKGTRLLASSDVFARDDEARQGIESWHAYDGATAGYREQVFFHKVETEHDKSLAALVNDDIGLSFEWDATALPYLTQWKNVREGIYVCGIEPGNCIPEGQNAARKNERLHMLGAGEERFFGDVRLSVLDGADAMHTTSEAIMRLSQVGTTVKHCKLDDFRPR
jgi:Domain of unknown function (DUF4432)